MGVGVGVGVLVGVFEGVIVGVTVGVAVDVTVMVGVTVGVTVIVGVGVGVVVGVRVGVGVKLGIATLPDAGAPLLTMLLNDNLAFITNRCCLAKSMKLGGVAMAVITYAHETTYLSGARGGCAAMA